MNELTESQLLNQLDDQIVEMSNFIHSYRQADTLEVKQFIVGKMMTRSTEFNVRAGHLGTGIAEAAAKEAGEDD
ncbi:hypothetical protein [Limosilactobacillus sp.]|jgi:hypothetical protein|uniref:hypothetical protein n=1 Tax=Limosilactobacillus sp. TaxID=2773925 RepID=UPI0025C2E76B|nr:hypothetical protein [Limosilactobacillus sp.]MCH3922360.1 hypothetical protein [Limosilactobacillus sp.]MCH3929132.1 hypothetical protein [Limosilactobacillus sp.]